MIGIICRSSCPALTVVANRYEALQVELQGHQRRKAQRGPDCQVQHAAVQFPKDRNIIFAISIDVFDPLGKAFDVSVSGVEFELNVGGGPKLEPRGDFLLSAETAFVSRSIDKNAGARRLCSMHQPHILR